MNITEFAKAAGVSKAAVSRYFNGGYLSSEKKALIEAAIEATGYRPSVQAQNLRTGQTKQVGVVLPRLTSESCVRMLEGISSLLEEKGYQIIMLPGDGKKETAALELLRQGRVDGMIYMASVLTKEQRKLLTELSQPMVILGQQIAGKSCIYHDDTGAAKAVTEHLLAAGRTTPALLGVTLQDRAVGAGRRRGFEEAVREAGLTVPQSRMLFAQTTMESGFQQAKRLLSGLGPAPDCILCATEAVALGAMEYCRSEGIRIPEDVMVASIGDSRPGRMAGLTSAHLHYRTAGVRAAGRLLELLTNPTDPPRSEMLGFEIRVRTSTGGTAPLDAAEYWAD